MTSEAQVVITNPTGLHARPAVKLAQLAADEMQLHFVDVPGHERFIKNMLAGTEAIDVALFVVAADEGWMPTGAAEPGHWGLLVGGSEVGGIP